MANDKIIKEERKRLLPNVVNASKVYVFRATITDGYYSGRWRAYRDANGIPTLRNISTGEVMQTDSFKRIYKELDSFCRYARGAIYGERMAG